MGHSASPAHSFPSPDRRRRDSKVTKARTKATTARQLRERHHLGARSRDRRRARARALGRAALVALLLSLLALLGWMAEAAAERRAPDERAHPAEPVPLPVPAPAHALYRYVQIY